MIMQEIASMVDEDKMIDPSDAHDKFKSRDSGRRSPHNLTMVKRTDSYDDFGGAEGTCEQCGGMTYEGQCMESGCGYMEESETSLNEGGCGCNDSHDDGSDYSIDSMMSPVYGLGATSMHIDFPNHGDVHKHKHNNYMAKPALYKVAKYAQKLLQMIPDGYELDDWQRTKIAQISDDISEVYHSLDYDFYDDEC